MQQRNKCKTNNDRHTQKLLSEEGTVVAEAKEDGREGEKEGRREGEKEGEEGKESLVAVVVTAEDYKRLLNTSLLSSHAS